MYTIDAVRMVYVVQHMSWEQAGFNSDIISRCVHAFHSVWIMVCILAGIAFALSLLHAMGRNVRNSQSG